MVDYEGELRRNGASGDSEGSNGITEVVQGQVGEY